METPNSKRLEPSIAAIVVTYNRLALLKESIDALRSQTHRPREIIVIDNGSTDDTPAWLAEQSDLTVVRQDNQGSSGGQYTGIQQAYARGHDWFWCMDDDTIPHLDALERMVLNDAFTSPTTGFLSSVVVWTDGNPHRMNTPGTSHQTEWFHSVLKSRSVRVGTSSFVSVLIARAAVARVGLPIRDLFIWYDDVEFTSRITRHFNGFFVLDSIVVHKTPVNAGPSFAKVEAKDRTKYLYGTRNRVISLRRSGLPAILRWAEIIRTVGSAAKRAILGRAPWTGVAWAIRGLFFRAHVDFPAE